MYFPFLHYTIGAKDPAKAAASIVRYCLRSTRNTPGLSLKISIRTDQMHESLSIFVSTPTIDIDSVKLPVEPVRIYKNANTG